MRLTALAVPICIWKTFSADRRITISPILLRIALAFVSFYLLICRFRLHFHRAFLSFAHCISLRLLCTLIMLDSFSRRRLMLAKLIFHLIVSSNKNIYWRSHSLLYHAHRLDFNLSFAPFSHICSSTSIHSVQIQLLFAEIHLQIRFCSSSCCFSHSAMFQHALSCSKWFHLFLVVVFHLFPRIVFVSAIAMCTISTKTAIVVVAPINIDFLSFFPFNWQKWTSGNIFDHRKA